MTFAHKETEVDCGEDQKPSSTKGKAVQPVLSVLLQHVRTIPLSKGVRR